jgi:hypothetical protein
LRAQIQLGLMRAEVKKQGHTNKRLREMELLAVTETICDRCK